MRTCVQVLSDHPKCEDGHFQQVVAYESQTTGGRGGGGRGGGGAGSGGCLEDVRTHLHLGREFIACNTMMSSFIFDAKSTSHCIFAV